MVFRYLLYSWKVLLCCVEMVDRHVVHCNVHHRAVTALTMAELSEMWLAASTGLPGHVQSARVFHLKIFGGLEDGWQQALIVHE